MKQLLLLLLMPLALFSQQRDAIVNKLRQGGEAYIDSMRVNLDSVFLDPDNIVAVRSFRGDKANPFTGGGAATFISRKVKKALTPLSVLIANTQKNSTLAGIANVLVFVDGKKINDPQGYLIEDEAIKDIKIFAGESYVYGDRLMSLPAISIITKLCLN